jgi:DnaK suppressor protein
MRNSGKKKMLTEKRRALVEDIQQRVSSRRGGPGHDIRDALEQTDADTQNDLSLARLQSQSAALARVEEALARVAAGTYGTCSACEAAIAPARLRALPFAIRCQTCETDRERTQGSRTRALNGRASSLFGDRSGP